MIRSTQAQLPLLRIFCRIGAAVLGGYAFTWGFTAAGMAGLVALGVGFHEAETGVLMLSFLVYLGVFLWAFAHGSMARVWLALAGGGAVMTLAAWGIQQALLA
ncbi:MAG TPA: iron uptake protein [Limnobacter sp.]|nr:iron uptake protein [Limnobacter sp.]